MLRDSQYFNPKSKSTERTHRYGENVHLLSDPYHENLLARFSVDQTVQPEINRLARELSSFLAIQAINALFPRSKTAVKTRMKSFHREAEFEASLLSNDEKAVVVDLMRAGIIPSLVCYEILHRFLKPKNIRQDHIFLDRKTNAKGEVIGVKMGGHKIGGPVKDAFVFLPDPMGATGTTIVSVLELYKNGLSKLNPLFKGKPKKFIALHFIVTPEYLKRVEPFSDILEIFALRLDRGLSDEKVLKSELGKFWNKERGLNANDYIVPGAGGIGEILNNSFV
ncbi:MAG: uracil phosphoribosyltransferase [Bacteriovoracaceae bacterium]|nr:uracil phosphoribosyltransferase [Bacteriovoracaceae bacterium]